MLISNFIFKSIYNIRSKSVNWRIHYRLTEYSRVYPNKIIGLKNLHLTKMPDFYFDSSDSQMIIDQNVTIRGLGSFVFFNGGRIRLGENTFFNTNCSINSLCKVQIGANCLFGQNVSIYDHNHQFRNKSILIKDQGYTTAPVQIGNNCWIGSNVIILKGVTIGNNCVIGANCIIHNDIPDNSLVYSETSNSQVIKPIHGFIE